MSKSSLKRAMAQAVTPKHERAYSPPNAEQLFNFVCASVGAISEIQRRIVKSALDSQYTRQKWLRRHRELQDLGLHLENFKGERCERNQ